MGNGLFTLHMASAILESINGWSIPEDSLESDDVGDEVDAKKDKWSGKKRSKLVSAAPVVGQRLGHTVTTSLWATGEQGWFAHIQKQVYV